jgi:DNA polymerase-3 subunit gamma/tau
MDRFIVSARKYRPAMFRDVVGQPSISTTLRNSILNKHLGHAYLFSGPRGVGKTTCARIFARTINCSNITDSGEACNECESCQSFNQNRSFSIHELDAASNNSVDDIRTLTEQVRIPPQVGTYSIYIIDEVHMLSQSAFNAFLKTLEEPPSHAVFILATTEKHKIIPTILSRCQIFDFNRIRVEEMVEYMKGIAEKESLEYEEDALSMIAQKADGAMRDALSIFDQVVSFSGGRITYQDVITNLNILDYEYFFRLTSSALEGDAASMLLLFNEILEKGFDNRNFINGYAAHLRDLMICKDPETLQLLEVGAGIREKYLSQSGKVSLPFIYEGLEICNQADIHLRASRNQRLTIELALVKLANLSEVQKKKPLPDPSTEQEPGTDVEQSRPERISVESRTPEHDNGASRVVRRTSISIKRSLEEAMKPEAAEKEEELEEEVPQETGSGPDDIVEENPDTESEKGSPDEVYPGTILGIWDEYASSFKKNNPRIFSTLKNNRPEVRADGSIRLRLNSEAQRDHFLKNIRPGLARRIKEATGMEKVEIVTEVTEGGQNEKKIYTDQDKLDFLMRKNPELGRLKTRFNLDFDH